MSYLVTKGKVSIRCVAMNFDFFTLQFKAPYEHLESEYREKHFADTLNQTRWVLIGGMLLYALFGFLDYSLSPLNAKFLWFIRFVIVIPFAGLVLGLTYTRHYKPINQLLLFLAFLNAGLGIQLMISLSLPTVTYSYYAGIILVIIIINTLIPLRFIWAMICSWSIVASYEFAAGFILDTPVDIFLNNSFFFISANIICMFSAYAIQYNARKSFLLNVMLENEKRQIDHINTELENRVTTRTHALQRVNQKLQESEKRHRLIAENINEVLYSIDAEGKILFITPVIESITGYSSDTYLGKPFIEFIHDDDKTMIMNRFYALNKGVLTPAEHRIMHRNNGHVWVKTSTKPVVENGHIVEFNGVLQDISESKKLQKQLNQARRMESIGTLAGGIAHDFNNILASIMGNAELLQLKQASGDNLTGYIDAIIHSSCKARDLIKQILMYARNEKQAVEAVNLSLAGKDAMNLLRATAPANVRIEVDFRSSWVVQAVPTQMVQVYLNLCSNALQAMEPDGGILRICVEDILIEESYTVDLTVLEPGHYVRLQLSDNGSGIAPEILDAIFEPYFTTKQIGQGSGLGLSVVHGIVQSYGGLILVDSEPDQGTTFTLYFPAEDTEAELSTIRSEQLRTGTETIMIVDDEPVVAKMFRESLAYLGYEIMEFPDGLSALEHFKKDHESIDLVITDMSMPGMNGDRMAAEILRICPEMPIILCTGYSSTFPEDKAHAMGISGYLHKPVDLKTLSQTIREQLDTTP